jgi:hypothetical protein
VEFQNVDIYSGVTLIDRTAKGGCEFIFDGIRFALKPGEVEKIVPKFVAKWLLSGDRCRVWTTEGDFVPRFAVKGSDADVQDIVDACGPEAADDSVIEIRTDLLERSAVAELDPAKRQVRSISVPATEFRERQGAGGRAAFETNAR